MNILEKIENIVKHSDTYLLYVNLFTTLKREDKNISLAYFNKCLNLLESIGKIIIVEDEHFGFCGCKVCWVGVDNPKLEKLLKESVSIK